MQTQTTVATALTVVTPAGTLVLSLIRRRIMERMASPVFTPEERLRANDSVYQCDDVRRLQLWHKNVYRVELEREAALLPVSPATEAEMPVEAVSKKERSVQQLASLSKRAIQYGPLARHLKEQNAELRRISDRAGELAYHARLADLLDETGLSHSDILSL